MGKFKIWSDSLKTCSCHSLTVGDRHGRWGRASSHHHTSTNSIITTMVQYNATLFSTTMV